MLKICLWKGEKEKYWRKFVPMESIKESKVLRLGDMIHSTDKETGVWRSDPELVLQSIIQLLTHSPK